MIDVNVNADTSGIEAFIGATGGILKAVADPRFQDSFESEVVSDMKSQFNMAAHSAADALRHVFDFPDQQGGVPGRALFVLRSTKIGGGRNLSFYFIPSTKNVPLPDPGRYGIDPKRLQYFNRHKFPMKALIMETKSQVQISPKSSHGRLFIPSADAPGGFFVTNKTVTINPGGEHSTGAFATFWNNWFNLNAAAVVKSHTTRAEQVIASTGQKIMRYAAGTKVNGASVGGQFARGKSMQIAVVNGEKRTAELTMKRALQAAYDGEGEDWSEEE